MTAMPVSGSHPSSHSHESHSPMPFSKAHHFALILLVPVLGVAYALTSLTDSGWVLRIGTFFTFLFALSLGVGMLQALDNLHRWEDRNGK